MQKYALCELDRISYFALKSFLRLVFYYYDVKYAITTNVPLVNVYGHKNGICSVEGSCCEMSCPNWRNKSLLRRPIMATRTRWRHATRLCQGCALRGGIPSCNAKRGCRDTPCHRRYRRPISRPPHAHTRCPAGYPSLPCRSRRMGPWRPPCESLVVDDRNFGVKRGSNNRKFDWIFKTIFMVSYW